MITEYRSFATHINSPKSTLTAWKVFKYGFISGPYFLVLGLNTSEYSTSEYVWILNLLFILKTGKYGPEINPYLDTFHAVTWVNRHAMNESYCDEISENLTTFLTVHNAKKKEDVNKKLHFLQLLGLLFVKDHKIEFQRNIKASLNLMQFCGLHTFTIIFTKLEIKKGIKHIIRIK